MKASDGQWIDVNNQAIHLVDQPGHESHGSLINTALGLEVVILWTTTPKTLPECTDCVARQRKTGRRMTGNHRQLSTPRLADTWMAMRVHWHGYRVASMHPGSGCWMDSGEPNAVLFTPTEVADGLTDSTGVVAVRPGVRYVGTRGPVQCFDWPLDLTLHANNEVIASRGDSVQHSYLTDDGAHVHLIAQAVSEQLCGLHPVAVDLTTVDSHPNWSR